MTNSEAIRLIAMLAAYWGKDVTNDTALLWANELQEFELQDGMEAAQILGQSGRFMPPLADFTATIRECRNDRLRDVRAALPKPAFGTGITFTEFLSANPEYRDRVNYLQERKRHPSMGPSVGADGIEAILRLEMGPKKARRR